MWQFILRIFGRSKVEPVKKKSTTVVDLSDTSTTLKQILEVATKPPVDEPDHGARERSRNRAILNSIAKGESMASRRLVKTPATGSKSHNVTPADDVVFIPTMTIQNTYPGYENRTNTQNCNSYTDSGSSDSGCGGGSGSD